MAGQPVRGDAVDPCNPSRVVRGTALGMALDHAHERVPEEVQRELWVASPPGKEARQLPGVPVVEAQYLYSVHAGQNIRMGDPMLLKMHEPPRL
jgi:hypothetical protein